MRPAIRKKKEEVEHLAAMLKDAKLVGFIRLRNLPDKIFQNLRKGLRGRVGFKVAKATVIKRALEKIGRSDELTKYLNEPVCIVWSNEMTPYQVFRYLKENKGRAPAKPGQIAPFDIIVPAGETDIPPGPALTELKSAKINAQVKAGKIVIAKDSIVAKEGEKITSAVASALQKLNILPFEIGAEFIIVQENGVLFTPKVLDVAPDVLTVDLNTALASAFALSINRFVPTSTNIEYLLTNSLAQALTLGINSSVYSSLTIGNMISQAVAFGMAIEGLKKEKVS